MPPTGPDPTAAVVYNGYPASSITAEGASLLGIQQIRSLVSRGLLLDVARAKGLELLEPGYPITRCRPRRRLRPRSDSTSSRVTWCWSAPGRPPTWRWPGGPGSAGSRRRGTSWPTPGPPRG